MAIEELDVIIVGAGCSGLSAAKYLSDLKIKILEKNNYIGGRVSSKQVDNLNVELGALFPLVRENNSELNPLDENVTEINRIRYIRSDGIEINGESILDILRAEDSDNILSSYVNQVNATVPLQASTYALEAMQCDYVY